MYKYPIHAIGNEYSNRRKIFFNLKMNGCKIRSFIMIALIVNIFSFLEKCLK
jgi:hypothetical protein